ncbi:MAG: hypothetical protein R3C11_23580 [Planctomycetaceae bacterium]
MSITNDAVRQFDPLEQMSMPGTERSRSYHGRHQHVTRLDGHGKPLLFLPGSKAPTGVAQLHAATAMTVLFSDFNCDKVCRVPGDQAGKRLSSFALMILSVPNPRIPADRAPILAAACVTSTGGEERLVTQPGVFEHQHFAR